jgi:hypothetical protein
MDITQAKFEGWAIIELFGHNREAGFVTTQYYGNAAMFQLDVPELQERELELTRPQWVGNVLAGKGSKVKKEAKPGRSRLINPSACYAINPCTKEMALRVLEELVPRDIKIVELAVTQQIGAGGLPGEEDHTAGSDFEDEYEDA